MLPVLQGADQGFTNRDLNQDATSPSTCMDISESLDRAHSQIGPHVAKLAVVTVPAKTHGNLDLEV